MAQGRDPRIHACGRRRARILGARLDAWKKTRESNPWSARIRPFMRLDPGSPGVYRRIYPK